MNTSILNLNQTPSELDRLYGKQDYYWYLRSPEFQKAFLEPLGLIVAKYGKTCLDVGCGEGQLGNHVPASVQYIGVDSSSNALVRGHKSNPNLHLRQGRIENPSSFATRNLNLYRFDVVLFGNILKVIISENKQVELFELYQQWFSPIYFIVYDLEIASTIRLDMTYQRIEEHHLQSEPLKDVEPVKLNRKILVYKC